VRERERERLKVIYVLDAKYEHSKKKKKTYYILPYTGKIEMKKITKIKMDILYLAMLFLPCAKYNGKKEVFIAKVTSFLGSIMLNIAPIKL